jgi:hypothetical protein
MENKIEELTNETIEKLEQYYEYEELMKQIDKETFQISKEINELIQIEEAIDFLEGIYKINNEDIEFIQDGTYILNLYFCREYHSEWRDRDYDPDVKRFGKYVISLNSQYDHSVKYKTFRSTYREAKELYDDILRDLGILQ